MNEHIKNAFPGIFISSIVPIVIAVCAYIAYAFHKCACIFIMSFLMILALILCGATMIWIHNETKRDVILQLLSFGFIAGIALTVVIVKAISVLSA